MQFGANIRFHLRMICTKFGDPLTFHLAPSFGQTFNCSKTFITKYVHNIPISLSCALCLVLISKC